MGAPGKWWLAPMILSRVKTAFLVPAGDSVGRGNRTGSEMMSSCRGRAPPFRTQSPPLPSTRPGYVGEPTPPRQGRRTLVCYIPSSFLPGAGKVRGGPWKMEGAGRCGPT